MGYRYGTLGAAPISIYAQKAPYLSIDDCWWLHNLGGVVSKSLSSNVVDFSACLQRPPAFFLRNMLAREVLFGDLERTAVIDSKPL
jgi:hypothetical protein